MRWDEKKINTSIFHFSYSYLEIFIHLIYLCFIYMFLLALDAPQRRRQRSLYGSNNLDFHCLLKMLSAETFFIFDIFANSNIKIDWRGFFRSPVLIKWRMIFSISDKIRSRLCCSLEYMFSLLVLSAEATSSTAEQQRFTWVLSRVCMCVCRYVCMYVGSSSSFKKHF